MLAGEEAPDPNCNHASFAWTKSAPYKLGSSMAVSDRCGKWMVHSGHWRPASEVWLNNKTPLPSIARETSARVTADDPVGVNMAVSSGGSGKAFACSSRRGYP